MDTKITFSESSNGLLDIHFIFEGDKPQIKNIPSSFNGKMLESIFLPETNQQLIGLGKKAEVNEEVYRRAGAKATKTASTYKIKGVHFSAQKLSEKECIALLEGAVLANYSFDKYKTTEESKFFKIKQFSFRPFAKKYSQELENALLVCQNVFLVRELVSDNSNTVTPEKLEEISRKTAKQSKLKITVLQEPELKKLGFNLLLNVASASTTPPKVIILEYKGNKKSKDKIMFAGKGVCFDSGGLNIKPGDSMTGMRMDMAGAATVIGILKSASELKMKKNIIGIIGCVENLIGSKAYRPGDVIKSFAGKTVENLNCDAEGRLVLADLLSYGIKKFKPALIVEYSTLTGSIVGTFGSHCAGLFSTNKEIEKTMFEAGLDTFERVWPMPLFQEYKEETKGENADLRSIGKTRYNGAIFAAAFLAEFTEKTPFIHLDVAGTATLEEPKDYQPKNGSGFGVRLAIEFLKKTK